MDRLAGKNKDKVIDLLAERLSFERASVKLYDRVLHRMEEAARGRPRSSDGDYTTYGLSGYRSDATRGMHDDIRREVGRPGHQGERQAHEEERVVAEMLPHVRGLRDQEKEHQTWLEQCIRNLGGDPKRTTEMAKLTEREVKGIEAVIMKDPVLPHLFHALLAAEHVDSAGWDLLVELADAAGDVDAKRELERRLHEEEQHLAFVREALRIFSAHAVLNQDLQTPAQGQMHPSTS